VTLIDLVILGIDLPDLSSGFVFFEDSDLRVLLDALLGEL
jgi:hypothetical protein